METGREVCSQVEVAGSSRALLPPLSLTRFRHPFPEGTSKCADISLELLVEVCQSNSREKTHLLHIFLDFFVLFLFGVFCLFVLFFVFWMAGKGQLFAPDLHHLKQLVCKILSTIPLDIQCLLCFRPFQMST